MKICEKLVHHAEMMSGLDKNVSFRRAGFDSEIAIPISRRRPPLFRGRLRGRVLQRAHNGRAHRKNRTGVIARLADGLRRLL